MDLSQLSKSVLSDVTVHMKYAADIEEEARKETWPEICSRGEKMHSKRFPGFAAEIREAFHYVREKKVLPSMRAAQFAGRAIESKHNRIFNCSYLPMDTVVAFKELFYNLLCGSGVGFSVQHRHTSRLPKLTQVDQESYQDFVIPDTIEGWCDSLDFLVKTYTGHFGELAPRPRFHFHLIRPKGALLVTSGGIAPGPEPLQKALVRVERILQQAQGRQLRSLEIHDINCHAADAVHAGGIRRAAMISFFDRWDESMLYCKAGNWWLPCDQGGNLQRSRCNNSAVFVRGSVAWDEFKEFWSIVQTNNTGEPGIYWTWDADVLANPCAEISLNPQQFCNLTTVNGADCRTEQEFFNRVRMAARIGTLQASYTDFSYLRSVWSETTAREALLGVSITGIGAGFTCRFDLKKAALIALAENQRVAMLLGINVAARTTCVKPEGSASCVVGSPSGIHSWHAPFYLRRLRVGKEESIYSYLVETVPSLIEDEVGRESESAVFSIPIQANAEGYFRQHETASRLLERVKRYSQDWIAPAHRQGTDKHNVSCTISLKDHEWESVGQWMWNNQNEYNGITVLPFDGGSYQQMPFEDIDAATFHRLAPLLSKVRVEDVVLKKRSAFASEAACAGGVCEL